MSTFLSSLDRIALSRLVFGVFSPFAILIGLAMAISPETVWNLLGVQPGNAALVAILYGCVRLGVGVVSLAAMRNPCRLATLLLFIGVYKSAAAVLLALHGMQQPLPVVGWVIAVAYCLMALLCLWLYAGFTGQTTAGKFGHA